MTKQERVELINEVIQRSPLAVQMGAKAEVDEGGKIRYSTRSPRHPEFERKESFRSILSLLHGADARAIMARVKGVA